MDINEIKDIVEENYGINIKSISKVKNSYNVKADEGEYCIKNIKYDFPHFNFIISAIEHLQKRKFKTIPEILPNKDGNKYIVGMVGCGWLSGVIGWLWLVLHFQRWRFSVCLRYRRNR